MSVDPNWFKCWQKPRVQSFGDLLKEYVKKNKWTSRLKWRRLNEAWQQAVGSEIARKSRVAGFRRGTMTVEVNSSLLMQQLRGFRKREILKQIQANENTQDVTDLHFRIGGSPPRQDRK